MTGSETMTLFREATAATGMKSAVIGPNGNGSVTAQSGRNVPGEMFPSTIAAL